MTEKLKCECECCGEETKSEKVRTLKIFFCPKCKSKDVGYIFALRNIFGVIPKMRCKKCGFESMGFPLLVVDKEKLNKKNKKYGKK